MKRAEAILRATEQAKVGRIEMVVVHAPLELAEEAERAGDYPDGVYGYCPADGANILFEFALRGRGQTDCPAQGIIAVISPSGEVLEA